MFKIMNACVFYTRKWNNNLHNLLVARLHMKFMCAACTLSYIN
jgi:hypothetical protein